MAQIVFEGAAAGHSQFVFCFWKASLKGLGARDITSLFKFARMHAEISVRGVHQALEVVESQRLVSGQGTDNAETHAFMNYAVQTRRGVSRLAAADVVQIGAGVTLFLSRMF